MVRTIAFFAESSAGGVDKKTLYCALFKALVAQLDRVLVSEAKGRGFDSRRAHQKKTYGQLTKGQLNQIKIYCDYSVISE